MLINIAAFSYSLSAVAFLSLCMLLLTSWRGRLHGMMLTIACLMTSLWAATIAFQSIASNPFSLIASAFEILRNLAWTIFLFMVLGPFRAAKVSSRVKLKPSVAAIVALYMLLLAATIYFYSRPESASGTTAFMIGAIGRVALAVIGMLLVEQLYRNTPAKDRWGIKFACMGIGVLFAYDFYLYSDAMLFKRVNIDVWSARGIVDALAVPLVAVSAARNPKWSLGISVSRRIVFHSAAALGSAIYLLAMAGAGYYLRFIGGRWGTIMQMVFLFGALILLIVVLFSGAFRSWLRVFISKNFYNYNYDYREEWLRFTRILSEDNHELGERAIQAVAELVESPGGLLYISRESGNCEPAARWNMPQKEEAEPANGPFCQFLENKQWVFDIQEYKSNPEKFDAIAVPQWLQSMPQAWLVVPLVLHGKLFGFVVLGQPRSKVRLNWEVLDLLKIAGSQAASYLAQQESAHALMVARQFESFNRMSTFVVHDLKNLIAQLSLLLRNAEKHKNNPEFQKDMLETVDLSIQKMKLLLHKLARGISVESTAPVRIGTLLQQAVASKSAFEPKPVLEVSDPGLMVLANETRLERVLGHMIQNAIEATPRDGKVTIRTAAQEKDVVVEIMDTGHGMSEDFIRDRLFKPFESTKSAGMGIGVFESREYVEELGGRIEVASCPSIGTTFRVILPLHSQVVEHAA